MPDYGSRPAWRGMGWWKWLSLLLVLYSLVIIVPYAERAGGSNGLGQNGYSASLGGCDIHFAAQPSNASLSIRARIVPQCALGLSNLSVVLTDGTGIEKAQAELQGSPNRLGARLTVSQDIMAWIVFRAETENGSISSDPISLDSEL